MADIDKANAYAYKGCDFSVDLHNYLTAKWLEIRTVDFSDGWITVMAETSQYNFPQYVQWGSIACKIKRGEE